jgi:LuxR family transcriptional regulator, maltose regulon positive regulatory protein
MGRPDLIPQTLNIIPAPQANQDYPLWVFTLGRFSVARNAKPISFAHKAQCRPLLLLKALIALGGRGVSSDHLASILWEDADADAAHAACKTVLHRLRKLLAEDAAILLSDNHLSLNPDKVWVDAWAFERALSQNLSSKSPEADGEAALAMYHGPFLGEDAAPWALPMREKLRAKFLRALTQISRWHMEAGRHEEAVCLLDRGLVAEPLAEQLYGDLMRCHMALSQRAEVLLVYQRCCNLFNSWLGIDPSPNIQALYRSARDNSPLPP